MARHSARPRRLTAKVQGRHENLGQARLAAMSDEELEAEMVKLAIRGGYPGDPAQLDFASANAWIGAQIQEFLEELPDGNAG